VSKVDVIGLFDRNVTKLIYLIFCVLFYSVFYCSFLGNISFVATLKFEKNKVYVCMYVRTYVYSNKCKEDPRSY